MYRHASRSIQHKIRPINRFEPKSEIQVIPESLHRALSLQRPVRGVVTAVNKGRCEVRLNGVYAFCPYSLMYPAVVSKADKHRLVDQILDFIVVEITSRSVIVSQRAVVRQQSLERVRAAEKSGEVLVGTVTSVLSYGAFIDLGAINGLIHISEIVDHRVDDVKAILRPKMSVRVVVLQVDERGERIALSMRKVPQ